MRSIEDWMKKSMDEEPFSKEELEQMLAYPPDSKEAFIIMSEAGRISRELTNNQAEVHAQFALNLGPCKCNCEFCSFADVNHVFTEEVRISDETAKSYAKQFEAEGANAVYIMITGAYPFELFIEIAAEIRNSLMPETILIANVGDQNLANAQKMKDIGLTGVYHALRMREGVETALKPENRIKSIRNFQEAGLEVGTCVEPVGPEHSNKDLAEKILFTASFNPAYSGSARRIPIPGTAMARRGTISELRMTQIVAVTRIGVPRTVLGNCTHEPCTLGAIGGASLFWAEVGANPRDVKEKTEEGRGKTIGGSRELFSEAGWDVYNGPSRYFTRNSVV